MNELQLCFQAENTDKGPHWHDMGRHYLDILSKYKNKPVVYLEIGVAAGGSLKAIKKFLPNATVIGLDINSEVKSKEEVQNNIFIEIGDATNSSFISSVLSKHPIIDIILDDGSHYSKDVFRTFTLLYPHLSKGGIYIVEDTNVYNTGYKNTDVSHLQFFWELTKNLNITDSSFCGDPCKRKTKPQTVYEETLDWIHFGHNFIAIKKRDFLFCKRKEF